MLFLFNIRQHKKKYYVPAYLPNQLINFVFMLQCTFQINLNILLKGKCGKVAVFGGCLQYSGAPYFSAISALKVGSLY
jgi:hypothetical protein